MLNLVAHDAMNAGMLSCSTDGMRIVCAWPCVGALESGEQNV